MKSQVIAIALAMLLCPDAESQETRLCWGSTPPSAPTNKKWHPPRSPNPYLEAWKELEASSKTHEDWAKYWEARKDASTLLKIKEKLLSTLYLSNIPAKEKITITILVANTGKVANVQLDPADYKDRKFLINKLMSLQLEFPPSRYLRILDDIEGYEFVFDLPIEDNDRTNDPYQPR